MRPQYLPNVSDSTLRVSEISQITGPRGGPSDDSRAQSRQCTTPNVTSVPFAGAPPLGAEVGALFEHGERDAEETHCVAGAGTQSAGLAQMACQRGPSGVTKRRRGARSVCSDHSDRYTTCGQPRRT
ncbi:unnamed protein product, partial [Iphiclides podalirius]